MFKVLANLRISGGQHPFTFDATTKFGALRKAVEFVRATNEANNMNVRIAGWQFVGGQ